MAGIVFHTKKCRDLMLGETVSLLGQYYTIERIDWHPGILVGQTVVPFKRIISGSFSAALPEDGDVAVVW